MAGLLARRSLRAAFKIGCKGSVNASKIHFSWEKGGKVGARAGSGLTARRWLGTAGILPGRGKVQNNADFCIYNMAKKSIPTTIGAGKKTDTAARPVRTGKTGATGIIRETGKNGMGLSGNAAGESEGLLARHERTAKPGKPADIKVKGGRKKVPVILITNDDGIGAPGIRNLVEAVKGLGKVVVVAPDKPQSGMGHAITIGNPLRLHPMHHLFEGVEAWQCSGTPVDCVKLAVDKVLRRKPDLCLSGINHGANHSINVIYSGTMSAAVEAAIESIPSVGFSLLDYSVEADFGPARKYVRIIVENVLRNPMDKHLILNVNFPAVPDGLIKGM